MGGRGSKSATSAAGRGIAAAIRDRDEALQEQSDKNDAIEALYRESQKAADSKTGRGQEFSDNAAMAARLLETDIGQTLVKDADFKEFRRVFREAYTNSDPASAMSEMDALLVDGTNERPLHLDKDEWVELKSKAQDAYQKLYAKGYEAEQIAAANGFYNLISRFKKEGTVPSLVDKKGTNLDAYTEEERKKIMLWGQRHYGYGFADAVRYLRGHASSPGY